jgi:hypothetical protein
MNAMREKRREEKERRELLRGRNLSSLSAYVRLGPGSITVSIEPSICSLDALQRLQGLERAQNVY